MALLDDALDYLGITWDDKVLERKIALAVSRGKLLLEGYAGHKLDFDSPGDPQALLFDYLRYVRCDATEMFEQNYRHDLMRLRSRSFSREDLAQEAEG